MDRLENWLLALAVFAAPWASVDLARALGLPAAGPGIQPAYLPLLALVLVVTWRTARAPGFRPGELRVVVATVWIAVAAVGAWSVVDMGLVGKRPWVRSVEQFVQWGFFVAAALATARAVGRGRLRWPERALGLGLLTAAGIAVLRAVAGPDASAFGVLDTNPSIASGSDELYLGHAFTGIARLRGPMPEPLMLGSYLLAAVPLVVLSGLGRHGWARTWRLGVAVLGLVCLFGTWSRGAWLGAGVTAVAVGVLSMRGWFGPVPVRRVAGVGLAGIALAGVVASLALQVAPWEIHDLLVQRIGQSLAGHDMSNMTRVWAWKAALDMFLDAPLLGQGWGSYGFLYFDSVAGEASGAHFGWPVPNNLGLLLLAETGFVGFVLWCAALGPALSGLVRRPLPAAAAVASCALLGVLVHLATFSQWNLPHLWLLFGFALAAHRMGNNSPLEA